MLAIITTHPIQYYAPVFQLLHQRNIVPIKVFYTWGSESITKHDPGFNKAITWDIPLLDRYPYTFVKNTSIQPGSHHFKGIVNPDLIAQLEALQPDAILIFGWAYQSHLKVIRYFKNKIPVLFRGDSTLLDDQKGLKAIARTLLLRWVYSHIDHAFYTGTNNKTYFRKFGLKEKQLTFAPHAIDNARFAEPRNSETHKLRQQLGISTEAILILFAGKFEGKKNPLLLLEAFNQLKADNCYLLFVGNGPLESQLKQTAATNANVRFLGFQNQAYMPVVYQAADLFCLPSQGPGETWGLAVNEAMAAGKAVLVSDKTGCAIDLVKNDYNGAIFRSNNLTDLTNQLKQLVNKKSLLVNYGFNSKQLIKSWNFEMIGEAIEKKMVSYTQTKIGNN